MNDRLFGISLRGESECAAWLDGLPGFCRVLEVPGAALDPRRLRGEVAAVCAERGIEWGVRDLLDADLARQLIRSGDALRIEACGKFEERALAAVAAGARWASLDLDAGRAAVDPDYETALHGLLRQFVGALSRLNAELPLLL
ncbi:MAG: hypothetical protein IJJ28_04935, partial [Lentisphaeria bacterium]|nr:hypothetical protein [Lentisphaeria bacterium]